MKTRNIIIAGVLLSAGTLVYLFRDQIAEKLTFKKKDCGCGCGGKCGDAPSLAQTANATGPMNSTEWQVNLPNRWTFS